MRRDWWTLFATAALFGLVFVAAFGERIAPYEPIYFVVEHGKDPRPYDPGLVFPFGSDVLGRDMFSIVLAGARATLSIVALAGAARVAAGVLVAAISRLVPMARVGIETAADVAGAVPATLVAVLLIQAFVRGDTSVPVVIGALLVTGWAGPYRVIRAESDRLASAPFTEGARTIGVGGIRLFFRHHVPHLLPVLALNLSQQVVASLVLMAELGVLGVVASAARRIDVTESLSVVRTGPPNSAVIPDTNEWGAMLSSARTVEILWATRWVIFVPGAAFALTAAAVAVIGYALARRYARRDVFLDLRRGAVLALAAVLLASGSLLVPERYAAAREWATSARSLIASAQRDGDFMSAAGLATTAVTRSHTTISRAGPATVTIDGRTAAEMFPEPHIVAQTFSEPTSAPTEQIHVRSLVTSDVGGGGVVEAPLVFAAHGIVPPTVVKPPLTYAPGRPPPDLATYIKNYPDDYASIDVRGKVVLLVRFKGVDVGVRGRAPGFTGPDAIDRAIKRGAAGVVMVDPDVTLPNWSNTLRDLPAVPNPYASAEYVFPAEGTQGVPVIAIDPPTADTLLRPLGIDVARYLDYDRFDAVPTHSDSRDLGVTARISVPLRSDTTSVTSLIGEVPGFSDTAGRIVVWMEHGRDSADVESAHADVLGALARLGVARHAPLLFVEFDPRADADAVRTYLRQRHVLVAFVVNDIEGSKFLFDTANGDLLPAIDLYADHASVPHETTRITLPVNAIAAPMPDLKTIVLRSGGPSADGRANAAALIAYAVGRFMLGAPELGR